MFKINSVRDVFYWLGHNLTNILPAVSLPDGWCSIVSRRKLLQAWTDVGTQRDPLHPVLMDFKDTIVHDFLISNIRLFWC